MQRATQDATGSEIRTFQSEWMDSHTLPSPSAEAKPQDWGHLDDGRLVVCGYGYACDSELAIQRERTEPLTLTLAQLCSVASWTDSFFNCGAGPASGGWHCGGPTASRLRLGHSG